MTTLFDNLMALSDSEAFYSVDQVGPDGALYRIFTYRLASYTDFMRPDALESRGIMFRCNGGPWELVSRPPEKFFNMGENPLTIGLDYSKVQLSMVKEDGSLISTYLDVNGALRLKTKASLHSAQALAAMQWLERQAEFKTFITEAEQKGWTVNCEWTSPLNRIVVPYQRDNLIVLNARHRVTGEYMEYGELLDWFGGQVVPQLNVPVEEVAKLAQGEGIVVFFGNEAYPRLVKVKAEAYLALHKLKDGVNQPNALFDAVVLEAVDDLKASFADDLIVQKMIAEMEKLVTPAYNHFAAIVEKATVSAKQQPDRKGYALEAMRVTNELLPDGQAKAAFGCCMNSYIGRTVNVQEAFLNAARRQIVGQYQVNVQSLLTSDE